MLVLDSPGYSCRKSSALHRVSRRRAGTAAPDFLGEDVRNDHERFPSWATVTAPSSDPRARSQDICRSSSSPFGAVPTPEEGLGRAGLEVRLAKTMAHNMKRQGRRHPVSAHAMVAMFPMGRRPACEPTVTKPPPGRHRKHPNGRKYPILKKTGLDEL